VGVPLQHARSIEVPCRCTAHDVHTIRSEDGKVHCSVNLLHEAGLFCASSDAPGHCHGADEALHEELAGEGEDHGVESHKGNIARSLAVMYWL